MERFFTRAVAMPELLAAQDVGKHYGDVAALDGVSLGVAEDESLAIVGESGSGKTTLGRLVVGLERPTAGSIRYRGAGIAGKRRTRAERRAIQLVPQTRSRP